MSFDSFEFSPTFDQQPTPAAQDQFRVSQYPEFLDHGSITYPSLLPSPAPNANTLPERHPYPAESDEDIFPPFSTYYNPEVGLAEAGRGLHFLDDDLAMDAGLNFHDSASSPLPSFKLSKDLRRHQATVALGFGGSG